MAAAGLLSLLEGLFRIPAGAAGLRIMRDDDPHAPSCEQRSGQTARCLFAFLSSQRLWT